MKASVSLKIILDIQVQLDYITVLSWHNRVFVLLLHVHRHKISKNGDNANDSKTTIDNAFLLNKTF